jgi:hypothetical protein
MAGNDTLTTATQNLVIAFNSINKTLQYINGQLTSNAYPNNGISTARIHQGRARIVSVVLLVDGGTVDLYDSSEASILPAESRRFTLDSTATIGYHKVDAEVTNGIILVVSGSSEATVTYSVY